MTIKYALLRNQILDFRESKHLMEVALGDLIHRFTDHHEGPFFVLVTRIVIDSLRLTLDKFEAEWQMDQDEKEAVDVNDE